MHSVEAAQPRRTWRARDRETKREGGRKGRREEESEWREQGAGSGSASPNDMRRRGGAQAASARPRGVAHSVPVGTVHQFQISNSTSNIPLKPILRASVTPKPRRVRKNSINKSCRSTYHLQLLLKLQSLIRPGLGDTRFQSGVHENSNMNFSHPRLSQFSRFQNSTEFNLWASV